MPSGRTHTIMTTTAAVALAATGHASAAAGALAGWILSPDLDVDAGYYGIHIVYTLAGDLAAKVWRWYWLPYARAVKHRSIVSHLPIISTAVRVVYLAAPALVAAIVTGHQAAVIAAAGSPALRQALAGLALTDAIHAVADVATTAVRRLR